jgi:hypothetical protein
VNAICALLRGAALMSALTGGCDMQSLRSSELFGGRDAATDGVPDAVVDRTSDASDANDAGGGTDATDGGAALDTAPDVAAMGMLSGTVIDTCTRNGLDALVGIAGRHTCSYPQKGSYFFRAVPLGTLKLAAAKEGYALFEATIEIVPGGNIHNIEMVPAGDGGCAALPSPAIACTCTTPTCEP